jgi:hypothetical protein
VITHIKSFLKRVQEVEDAENEVSKYTRQLREREAELEQCKNELKQMVGVGGAKAAASSSSSSALPSDRLKEAKEALKEAKQDRKDAETRRDNAETRRKEAKAELNKCIKRLPADAAAVLRACNENTLLERAQQLQRDAAAAVARVQADQNCFQFLQDDAAGDLSGFLHRYVTVDANKLQSDVSYRRVVEDLLRQRHNCAASALFDAIQSRVVDVRSMLTAMPCTKQIRELLAAIDEGPQFLTTVIERLQVQAVVAGENSILRDMRNHVVGAAQHLQRLTGREVAKTELGLQMLVFPLVSNLSVLISEFNKNLHSSSGAEISADNSPDVSRTKVGVEEIKLDASNAANVAADERRLVMFAYMHVTDVLQSMSNVDKRLCFTTTQVGFKRVTHVTCVFAQGGLVRFKLCELADIRQANKEAFSELMDSICTVYEYAMAARGDAAGLDALTAVSVPAAPAAPGASAALPDMFRGEPRKAAAPPQNAVPTPTKPGAATLPKADNATEAATLRELRAGTVIANNNNSKCMVVESGKRVFKVMGVTRDNERAVRREVQLLALASRVAPMHTVRLERAFSTAQFRWPCPFVALELCDVVVLAMARLQPLDWAALSAAEYARYGQQLCAALEALHAGGIVHFDIKPANIALDAAAGQLKLIDFGLAELLLCDDVQMAATAARGTKGFMAPEVDEVYEFGWAFAHSRLFTSKIDVFSAGVTLQRSPHAQTCDAASALIARMTARAVAHRLSAKEAAAQWRQSVAPALVAPAPVPPAPSVQQAATMSGALLPMRANRDARALESSSGASKTSTALTSSTTLVVVDKENE